MKFDPFSIKSVFVIIANMHLPVLLFDVKSAPLMHVIVISLNVMQIKETE